MTSTIPAASPEPVASQDWFVKNLQDALNVIPREKIIAAIGNYGYDWARKQGQRRAPAGSRPQRFGAGRVARGRRSRLRCGLR